MTYMYFGKGVSGGNIEKHHKSADRATTGSGAAIAAAEAAAIAVSLS